MPEVINSSNVKSSSRDLLKHCAGKDNKTISQLDAHICVQSLTIKKQDQVLVNDLSFKIKPKETLAIVGESGSGKSVSSLAVMGLLPQSVSVQGKVELSKVGDLPIASQPNDSAKQHQKRERFLQRFRGSHIAMVFQEPMTALNPLHNVQKQIAECLKLSGVTKSEIKSQVISLLNDVNIKNAVDKLDRFPHELSGGQRQRVMIAMALAQKPDVLIADEPTTALDVTLQHEILELLDTLKEKYGMAMLLISHDLNLVRRYSSKIIVMKAGVVIEYGDSDDVFHQPNSAYTQSLINQDFGRALPIAKTLELNNSEVDSSNKKINTQRATVQVKGLTVSYPAKKNLFGGVKKWTKVVDSIDFCILEGQALGIVGESGSGKTTIALALTRLLTHQANVQGSLIIDGVDINSLSNRELREFRSKVQMVFQDPFASINPRLSVMQIIEEGLIIQGVIKTQRHKRVLEALQTVNLPCDFADRYPHELSGGQRQRVALARALIMQPKFIILDEPTSALDSTTQVSIVELLRTIQSEFGISYLFISHDLKVVQALCQHIMVIKDGACVEYSSTNDLFKSPKHEYSKLLIESGGL